ncbi:MAG: beta-ketoacyl-ACP synthase II [Ardenticatenia bacterium]|nr:beta-ketoacyl-ACP synthase II [Ardenticatenia bacterium]
MVSSEGRAAADRPAVVVTGMGLITPIGIGLEATWASLMAGRSGVGPISRFDPAAFKVHIAAEVRDFDARDFMEAREARRLDRLVQFAVAGTSQALAQAGLAVAACDTERVGVLIGTGVGGFETIQTGFEDLLARGPNRVNPLTGAMMLPDMAAGYVAIVHGAQGPNHCVSAACATGSMAVGEAAAVIRRGDADVMIAGAVEAGITPFALAAFHRTGAMSTRNAEPLRASRPFDADRDGFVFGEGAGILILEREDHARARGATVLAELAGYGASADAYHVSAPREDGRGAALAMRRALATAGLAPEDVDYINAHGTGTVLNDLSETRAIHTVFGAHAPRLAVSSTKSMHGHLMGAAGAVEAVITVLTLRHDILPPTVNLDRPGEGCDLDYVPHRPRPAVAPLRAALSNSFGFGGHNASLLIRRRP